MATPSRSASAVLSLACVCAVALSAAACAPAGPAVSLQQQSAGVTIRFECDPAVAGESNALRIALTDEQGRPVTRARVVLRPGMPDMEMHARPLTAAPRRDGSYEVDGVRFSMSGMWQIVVDVRESSGAEHSATFAIVVKD